VTDEDTIAALLAAERSALGPRAEVAERLWARVEASVAAGGGEGGDEGGGGGGTTTIAGTGALAGPWSRLVPGLVVGVVVGAAGHALLRAPEIVRVEVPVEVVRTVTVTVAVERTAILAEPPSPRVVPELGRREAPSARPAPERSAAPASPPRETPPADTPAPATPEVRPSDDALAQERRLIDRARAALARGRTSDAREALAEHRDQHRAGRLAEERDALEVVALARLGLLVEARAAADRFFATYPRSFLKRTVEAAIATDR
jgi:hypothetical protein